MEDLKQINNEFSDAMQKLLFDHYYSLATEAAFKGDYSLASNYISDLILKNGEIPILLDLQAKINFQQGQLKQAEFLWEKCIKAEPDNYKYLERLNRLHKLQKSKITPYIGLIKLLGATIGILFLILMIIVLLKFFIENNSKLNILQNQQSEILKRIDKNSLANDILLKETTLSEIVNKLEKVDGINIKQISKVLVISFNAGLFSKGTKLKVDQESAIMELTKILEKHSSGILIVILGCSDNIPITVSSIYKNNHELGLARANLIYNIFYQSNQFPPENLFVGSIGDINTPYPNDSWENRMKNRTVLINIIPKE